MCGINGIVYFRGRHEGLQEKIMKMQRITNHRGPDVNDNYVMDRAALGTNVLQIVAPDSSASISSMNSNGNYLVFNGELVNYKDLRERISHTPFNHTDTSLILPLYEEHGQDFVNYLAGMFSIAIYNKDHNRLQLWRDPLGVKPLYYHQSEEGIIFSSELKAIYAIMENPPDADFTALDHILKYRFNPGESTVFPRINKVLPGETITFENGNVNKRRYWTLEDNNETMDPTINIEEFRSLLEKVIDENTSGDANGGFFTSGGLDSSLVTSIGLQKGMSKYVQPISLRFLPNPVVDEEYAILLESYLNKKFEWVAVTDSLARSTLEELIPFLDEPLENPIHVGTYLMAKRARELGIKSVITGDGSDEFFLGYERQAQWFNNPNAVCTYPSFCWTMKPQEADELYTDLAKNAVRPMINGFGNLIEPISNLPSALQFERLERMTQYHNMRLDRMTMAHGVEAKVPFLDHRIVEYSLRIPSHILIGKTRKEWLKEVSKPYLPKEIINRDKILFPSLADQWISSGGTKWAGEILLDSNAEMHQWVRPDILEKYLSEHKEKRHPRGKLLWALITLELWLKNLKK